MVPGDDPAVGIEPRLGMLRRERTELAEHHVVLAAPDQLDRLAHRLREEDRIDDHLLRRAAAVASADPLLVQRDVGRLGLQEARHFVEETARALGAGPDLGRFAVRGD